MCLTKKSYIREEPRLPRLKLGIEEEDPSPPKRELPVDDTDEPPKFKPRLPPVDPRPEKSEEEELPPNRDEEDEGAPNREDEDPPNVLPPKREEPVSCVPPRLKLGVADRPPILKAEDDEGVNPKLGVLVVPNNELPPKEGAEKLLEVEGVVRDPPNREEPVPAKRLEVAAGWEAPNSPPVVVVAAGVPNN